MMQHKSQMTSVLIRILALVQTQFQSQVQVIRTDNGSEFVNHAYNQLFKNVGIIHQHTCAYTPQQNRVVERKH